MDASIEVLGVSGGDVPSYDQHESYSTGQRLHCKVVVAQETSARQYFDNVTVTLQGVLYSKIGSRAAVERLLCLTQVQQQSYFEQTSSSKEGGAPSSHTEITFDLPEVLPSLSLAGTTSVTRSAALADRHLVSGECNIRYWLEAEFNSRNLLIRKLSCPVDFSKLMKPSHMTVLAAGQAPPTRQRVRVQRRGLSFWRSSSSLPPMTLEIPHELGVVASAPKTSGAGHQRLAIPLTVSVSQADGSSVKLSDGIENVSIQANWNTTKSFGTSKLVADDYNFGSIIRIGTIVRQKVAVSLPPFFQNGSIDQAIYSSTTSLDLILPDTIKDSSIKTDLVSISYELELDATFDIKLQNGGSVPCKSTMQIPLQVYMT